MIHRLNLAAMLPRQSFILPSQGDLDAMGRRRYQACEVKRKCLKNRKNDYWFFNARLDELADLGTKKRVEREIRIAPCREMGIREAEKRRDQIVEERGINRPEVLLRSQIIFGRVLEQFLQFAEAEVRSNTNRTYESICGAHIEPQFGKMRLSDITPQVCQLWLNGLRGKLSRSTRAFIVRLFRMVWARATDWGYTREICPLGKRAKLGPIEAGRAKTLPTVDQFRQIVQLLDEPCRSILLVATFTGLRISEIRGLQWGDVRGDSVTIHRSMDPYNEVHYVKSRESARVVPVGHLKTIFITSRGDRGPTQQTHGQGGGAAPLDLIFAIQYQTALDRLKAAAATAGIDYPGFGWHTFRRASVTWGKRAGASQGDSMAQHGHSDAKTNAVYYVEDDLDLNRRAALEAKVFELVMFGCGEEGRA